MSLESGSVFVEIFEAPGTIVLVKNSQISCYDRGQGLMNFVLFAELVGASDLPMFKYVQEFVTEAHCEKLFCPVDQVSDKVLHVEAVSSQKDGG